MYTLYELLEKAAVLRMPNPMQAFASKHIKNLTNILRTKGQTALSPSQLSTLKNVARGKMTQGTQGVQRVVQGQPLMQQAARQTAPKLTAKQMGAMGGTGFNPAFGISV